MEIGDLFERAADEGLKLIKLQEAQSDLLIRAQVCIDEVMILQADLDEARRTIMQLNEQIWKCAEEKAKEGK